MLKILLFSILSLFLLSCEAFKPKKVNTREVSTNAQERARKNIEQGKGTSLKSIVRGGETTYQFSTSNPMWRASLDILDFLPLTTVDYSGGMIITDWYAENNSNESIKISIRFLDNTVAAQNLKIIIHKKVCNNDTICSTSVLQNSKIEQELISEIVKKAARLEIDSKNKKK